MVDGNMVELLSSGFLGVFDPAAADLTSDVR
jgi:hypothetical protein